jgi:hypothetical protein
MAGRTLGGKNIRRGGHQAEADPRTLDHGTLTPLCSPSMVVESAQEKKADFVGIRLYSDDQPRSLKS